MTIRRIDKGGGITGTASARSSGKVNGDRFAAMLESATPVPSKQPMNALGPVGPIHEEPTPGQRKRQLARARDLLDTLEALEQNLSTPQDPELVRSRLQESRDNALHTLSDSPKSGEERELLHRTAVIATVELAKSDRGDYK